MPGAAPSSAPNLAAASTRVALVAVHAVIDVAIDVRVVEVRRVVAAMALRALEDRVVVRIGVACGAHAVGVAVINRELRVLRMVEGCRRPGSRRVAG